MSNIVKFNFHGDELDVASDNGEVFVSLRRACEALGIDRKTQERKLKEQPWAVGVIMPLTGSDGKTYDQYCVSLDCLPMWLASINVGKVRPELREKLVTYQKECARVLRDHFFGQPKQQVSDSNLMSKLDAMAADIASLKLQLSQSSRSCISPLEHACIRQRVKEVSSLLVWQRRHTSIRSASRWTYNRMGAACQWGGAGKAWHLLPAHLYGVAMSALAEIEKEVVSQSKITEAGRQLGFDSMK